MNINLHFNAIWCITSNKSFFVGNTCLIYKFSSSKTTRKELEDDPLDPISELPSHSFLWWIKQSNPYLWIHFHFHSHCLELTREFYAQKRDHDEKQLSRNNHIILTSYLHCISKIIVIMIRSIGIIVFTFDNILHHSSQKKKKRVVCILFNTNR